MVFLHFDLGQRQRGEIVEITLTAGANVQLMNAENFSLYKGGKKCRYYGGLITRSPYRITIPDAGSWHIAIDVRGLGNNTVATVKTLSNSKLIIGKQASAAG